ncbi:CDP-alcohol phosphatidyltransferase family protein [Seonamhaeicola maritimus]|uniref:CDP-alcohol phosphatidyltransferase n=1 Tax=Seonamhaeicola maritimus TaxID=2591822 RepID=A0A5C7GEM4_9FLAO|nr:CDP-alcohol phosphatidyltransferase family protein [Seonamhaeicola maritimus]TXG35177.1 CDP-alcohol phosphatidyltransferase [Seonamhaeicola maritimus]
MNTEETHSSKKVDTTSQLSMFRFILDLPNMVTLLGLLSALLGIYAAITGKIYIAVVFGVWSVVFDWLDGLVASKLKNRTNAHRAFGGQLDSLIDMVSFGVLPAIILLSYSNYNPWFIPGSFAIIAACAIRLSYFNIYGLTNGKTYTGLAVDYNGLIISLFFLIESFFSSDIFPEALYILVIIIVYLNVSAIQIPKFPKTILIGIIIYAIALTIHLVNL